ELACRLGTPVFCGSSLEMDDAHADALRQHVRESGLPVMMEMALRFAPAIATLRELLATRLGPARLLLCDVLKPERAPRRASGHGAGASVVAGLLGATGVTLLDGCASLLENEPVRVQATGADAAGLLSLLLEFRGGQALQLTRRRAPAARPALHLKV